MKHCSRNSGFALISTLSIMLLVVLLLVAMLSLSTTSRRSQADGKAMSEAQANARLALKLAIGDIQKYTGLDTRVTAPADVVDRNAPAIVGAWKSWEGKNHDPSTGRPITPDYSLKSVSNNSTDARFLAWLVSNVESETDEILNWPSEVATADTVPLLAEGSLGASDTRQIHVIPTETSNGGRFAWWVSPENQKARLSHPHEPQTDDEIGWADMAKSHSVPDPGPFDLENLVTDSGNYEEFNPDPDDPKAARKAISLATTDLIATEAEAQPHLYFHDLSISAVGLLTNTATGGWRKDLSLLTEKWDEIYSRYAGGKLPLFRYTPEATETYLVPKPTKSEYDKDQSVFYPWSDYVQLPDTNRVPLTYNTASGSWQSLVNFATAYRGITYDTATQTASAPIGWSENSIYQAYQSGGVSNNDFYSHYHDRRPNDTAVELDPVIARIQMIVQAKTLISPNKVGESDAQNHYRVNLRVVPIYTIWNPYNVEIVHSYGSSYQGGEGLNRDSDFGITVLRSMPLALSITNKTAPPVDKNYYQLLNPGKDSHIDTVGRGTVRDDQLGKNRTEDKLALNKEGFFDRGSNNWTFTGWLPLEFKLGPGEVKQFAPGFDSPTRGAQGPNKGSVATTLAIRLKEGYYRADDVGIALQYEYNFDPDASSTYNRLYKVPSSLGNNQLRGSDSLNIASRADRYTKLLTNGSSSGGVLFAVGTPRYPISLDAANRGDAPKGASYIKSVMATAPPMKWTEEYWPPFDFDDFPQYTVNELATSNWNDLISINFGPRLTFGGSTTDPQNSSTKGVLQSSPFASDTYSLQEMKPTNHPANGAYDISYDVFGTGNDNLLPTDGVEGYISTGYDDVFGISRLVMAEIPLRPMASLAELQHWNVRGKNPFPPHQFNLIGNSDATPMIEKNSILASNPMNSGVGDNLQHDDAYCSNHLLFDDWFFSSIAPDPKNFGNIIERDIKTVYEDFLKGEERLVNRAYLPITEVSYLSQSEASALADRMISSPAGDGWLKVASLFEVEGMFNVNSTSFTAWRALLGHARNQEVSHYTKNGMALDSGPHDHPVSRHSVASDVKAGEPSEMMNLAEGSEYSGFRTLSDDQLDDLAEKIVDQIQRRGPFLSLSEFVNRQLSSEGDLALAGALQSALNELTDDPVAPLKDTSDLATALSSATMDYKTDNRLGDVNYGFPEASEGVNTFGLPGYIRQADILRPIAPVLSARDDTFTIRTYGESQDEAGNVTARAWCEATIQRSRDFVNPEDPAYSVEPPLNLINQKFGRKYHIVSFRWLSEDEI